VNAQVPTWAFTLFRCASSLLCRYGRVAIRIRLIGQRVGPKYSPKIGQILLLGIGL
jgi:hypothetical protein